MTSTWLEDILQDAVGDWLIFRTRMYGVPGRISPKTEGMPREQAFAWGLNELSKEGWDFVAAVGGDGDMLIFHKRGKELLGDAPQWLKDIAAKSLLCSKHRGLSQCDCK